MVDLLRRMQGHPEYFFKTDTHWTPEGARVAASRVAVVAGEVRLRRRSFRTVSGAPRGHMGDLARYVPGISVEPEACTPYSTMPVAAGSLLGAAPAPQVVLVGTSYSANPDWNFAGFLAQDLRADVLNAAMEGQGPFAVMDQYLSGGAFKSAPPRLVIWEMPERYFLSPWR